MISAALGVAVASAPWGAWPSAWVISNGALEVVVVPEVGRVMSIRRPGGPNLLWTSPGTDSGGWRNWGGDKAWPAPQELWSWPPEAAYDGEPWEVRRAPRGVLMRSLRPAAKTGAMFERRIALHPTLPEVEFTTILANGGKEAREMSPWQVMQIARPERAWLPREGFAPYDWNEEKELARVLEDRVEVRPGKAAAKFGSGSPEGWVAIAAQGEVLELRARWFAWGRYPDEGRAQQLFLSAPDQGYGELELAGELRLLQPGESSRLDAVLRLR